MLSRFAYLGPSKGKRKTDRVRRGNACERNSVAFALKRASKRCLRPRQVRTEASSRAHQKQIEPQRRPFSIPPARCPVQNVGRLSSPSLGVCVRSFPSATALASSVFRDMIFLRFVCEFSCFSEHSDVCPSAVISSRRRPVLTTPEHRKFGEKRNPVWGQNVCFCKFAPPDFRGGNVL